LRRCLPSLDVDGSKSPIGGGKGGFSSLKKLLLTIEDPTETDSDPITTAVGCWENLKIVGFNSCHVVGSAVGLGKPFRRPAAGLAGLAKPTRMLGLRKDAKTLLPRMCWAGLASLGRFEWVPKIVQAQSGRG
jgi:hypothetical protein